MPLFNGKDLTGWKMSGGPDHRWKVVNGVIVSDGPTTWSRLDTTRADFANFILRVETKLAEGSDATVAFRLKQTEDDLRFYATSIPGSAATGTRTGDLERWTAGRKSSLAKASEVIPIRPGEWFTQEVIADGDTVTVLVQGKEAVKYKDPDRTLSVGAIALFCRGKSTVMFRKVEIKELSGR